MVVAKVRTGAPVGFYSHLIEVESDSTKSLPGIQIVGLANKSVDEAKERIKSAILNSHLDYPTRKITINLAPAELPKEGTHYDLPMALAVLVSSGQLRQAEVDDALFAGELALDGRLRPVKGAITLTEAAREAGISTVYLPVENLSQAQLISGVTVYAVGTLKDLFLHLKGEVPLTKMAATSSSLPVTTPNHPKLDDILGQDQAKRALLIAAAGRHNILLNGPPGAGKTMLAKALTGLLPPLTDEEQVAVTKLHSLSGESIDRVVQSRPFRAPHHTASRIALIGGGSRPQPGEISLAHLGVLFLDELPEYPRATLESLRQPLEDKSISIARAGSRVIYPADFMLIATMNPCPCGHYGDSTKQCTCSAYQIALYQKKLSGPLLDRIDLVVNVTRIPNDSLMNTEYMSEKQQNTALTQLKTATNRQRNRYKSSVKYNANLSNEAIKQHIQLSPAVRTLLASATDRLGLSARAYFKLLKVAQTIADLEDASEITEQHVSEALQYRQKTLD